MAENANLTTEQLESELTSWAGNLAAAEYRWLCLVAEYDRRKSYEFWECPTCAHWLMWRCSLNLRSAREKVRVARALEALPHISEEFAAGRLSYSKVRAVTRIAMPATETELVQLALHTTTSQLEKIVAAYRRVEQLALPPSEIERLRSCTLSVDEDGMYVLRARLAPDEGALLKSALEATADPGGDGSAEQRRADALIALASQAPGGDGGSPRNPFQVVIHIEADGATHVDNGPAVPTETIDRLCCDAPSYTVNESADGSPITVSPNTRAVSTKLRRAVRSRDRACRFPGCTHHVWVDTHHLTPRRRSGPNALANLLLLCRRHHRAVHEGGWAITGTADQPHFISPQGQQASDATPAGGIAQQVAAYDVPGQGITPKLYGDPLDLHTITEGLYLRKYRPTAHPINLDAYCKGDDEPVVITEI